MEGVGARAAEGSEKEKATLADSCAAAQAEHAAHNVAADARTSWKGAAVGGALQS